METIYREVIRFFVSIAATIVAGVMALFYFTGHAAMIQIAVCAAVLALVVTFAISSRGPRIIALRAYATLVLLASLALVFAVWRCL